MIVYGILFAMAGLVAWVVGRGIRNQPVRIVGDVLVVIGLCLLLIGVVTQVIPMDAVSGVCV